MPSYLRKGTIWPDASLTILLIEKSCSLPPKGHWTRRDMQMGESRAGKKETVAMSGKQRGKRNREENKMELLLYYVIPGHPSHG